MPYDLETIRKNQEYMCKLKERDEVQKETEIKVGYEKIGFEYPTKEKDFHGDCDNPNTMENGTATTLYIIVMLVGTIFIDWWLIWIIASVVYFRFIGRHKKK